MEVRELGHLVLYVRDSSGRRLLPRRARLASDRCRTPTRCSRSPLCAFSAPVGPHAPRAAAHRGRARTRRRCPPAAGVGLYHFGLKVGDSDDELREALAHAEATGVPVLGASDHTVTHSLYIADPDGNEIELYIDVPGVDWRNDPTCSCPRSSH